MTHGSATGVQQPSTPPRQVLMTRATVARCAADYADAEQLRAKPEPEVAR